MQGLLRLRLDKINLNDVLVGSSAMLAKCYGQKEVCSSKDRNKIMPSLIYIYHRVEENETTWFISSSLFCE